jgi:hypothetical protein
LAVLVDPGAEAGGAELESHLNRTKKPRLTTGRCTVSGVIKAALGTVDIPEIAITSATAPGVTRRWTNLMAFDHGFGVLDHFLGPLGRDVQNGDRFLGPAVLLQSYRWLIDSRDEATDQLYSNLPEATESRQGESPQSRK